MGAAPIEECEKLLARGVAIGHRTIVRPARCPHFGLSWACTAVGAFRTADATLSTPLGNRAVLEVTQGMPVSVTLTP